MHDYNKQLARKGLEIILAETKDSAAFPLPESCMAPYMANFYAPTSMKRKSDKDLIVELYDEEKVWIAVGKFQQRYYFRLSSNVYNTEEDYRKVAKAINSYCS